MKYFKNLTKYETVNKIKELEPCAEVYVSTASLSKTPLGTCTMNTQFVDDSGTIWLYSDKVQGLYAHICHDDRVQIFYSSNLSSAFLNIYGRASIVRDNGQMVTTLAPFTQSKASDNSDIPDYTLIKVQPIKAYYWDNRNTGKKNIGYIIKALTQHFLRVMNIG